MKNLISPETLAFFQKNPTPLKEVVDFLDSHPDITTVSLCKLTGISTQKIYDYKHRSQKKSSHKKKDIMEILPKNASKSHNRYTAEEKFSLIEKYLMANDEEKSRLLRTYGIYQSDIQRWRDQAKEASLIALRKRKERSDKKSSEQLKIEALEKELREQEKTSAKLSTLLMLQKKTFDILKRND